MPLIQLKNVTKYYTSDKPVVEDLSLDVRDGEFLVLVGPSGCGKSTILRMIAGLEDVSGGSICFNSEDVTAKPPKHRDIAMVFQNYAIYPHLNVYENMSLGLKLRKYSKQDIEERVAWTAEILGLTDYLKRKPKTLSGGQRQRVAVGRALVRDPAVFLFDEPLSNLDANLRTLMRTEIKKLHKRLGKTMIYVTHDQIEAMTMGDRIAVLNDGVVHQVDTPLELYNNPADLFVAEFIGSPKMNLVPVIFNQDRLDDPGETFSIPLSKRLVNKLSRAGRTELILGFRAEGVSTYSSKSYLPVSVNLEICEPLGTDIYIHFRLGHHDLIGRTQDSKMLNQAGPMEVYIDPRRVHFFDPETGRSV